MAEGNTLKGGTLGPLSLIGLGLSYILVGNYVAWGYALQAGGIEPFAEQQDAGGEAEGRARRHAGGWSVHRATIAQILPCPDFCLTGGRPGIISPQLSNQADP